MKKSVKKFFTLSLITISTLVAGFAITAISFKFYELLSANQMRVLFAVDVIALLAACTITHFFIEGKRNEAKKRQELEKRHNKRLASYNAEYEQIKRFINNDGFAA